MFGTQTDETPDAGNQLKTAREQHAALAASLPALQEVVQVNSATRNDANAVLERTEGDALIGVVLEPALTRARERHDAAVTAHRTAEANLRKASDDVARLADTIARLEPVYHEQRSAELNAKYAETVIKVRDYVTNPEFQALLQTLVAIRATADIEFPYAHPNQRTHQRPYPVSAGLPNLVLVDLLLGTAGGMRRPLDSWLERVEAFLNPPAQVDTPPFRNVLKDIFGPPQPQTRSRGFTY
ncbi:MAG: hypothetical protein ABL986_04230 [Vicinamibacterales bacterium]